MPDTLSMSEKQSTIETAAARLEALGNTTRLEMFRLLVRAGAQGLPVGDIQRSLQVPASTLSHHLKHLELVGLVTRRREGTSHFCSAHYGHMDAVISFLTEHCCVDE